MLQKKIILEGQGSFRKTDEMYTHTQNFATFF